MADSWTRIPGSSVVLAVHAALLPNGKVLYFSGDQHREEVQPPFDATRLWDPELERREASNPLGRVPTPAEAARGVENAPSPAPDLFCCGHCLLGSGDVLVAGGTGGFPRTAPEPHRGAHHFTGITDAFIYRWRLSMWERVMSMARGRWYPTCVTLPDGQVFSISGHNEGGPDSHENTTAEVLDPTAAPPAWRPAFSRPQNPFSVATTTPPLEDTGLFYAVSGAGSGAAVGAAAVAVVGAVVGFLLVGPAGAVGGATIGAAVGAIVGAAVQPKLGRLNPMIYYPRLHVLPDGRIFSSTALQVEGDRRTRAIELQTGVLTTLAEPPFEQPRRYSHHGAGRYMEDVYARSAFASVLLPLRPPAYGPRVLICGERDALLLAPALGARWQVAGGPRPYPMRAYANAVLLPDGTVLVVGGSRSERGPWSEPRSPEESGGADADKVAFAERYNPDTDTWVDLSAPDTQLTEALRYSPIARVYHSVALLLQDGRVWIAGSNHDGARNNKNGLNMDAPEKGDARELTMEVYSPPYLFRRTAEGADVLDAESNPVLAPRPTVDWTRAGCAYGQRFEVFPITSDNGDPLLAPLLPNQIRRVALVRCSSVTHAFNPDQRYVELTIDAPRTTVASLTLVGPSSGAIAPPGYYLLFILDWQGVPSVGQFFRVGNEYPIIQGVETRGDRPSTRFDFGDIELGQWREVTLQFTNVGVGQLRVRDFALESDRHEFRLEDIPAGPHFGTPGKLRNTTLTVIQDEANPGFAAIIRLRFQPTEYGQHKGVLRFYSNAPDAPMYTVSLTARCVGLALEITPIGPAGTPRIDFGDVIVGAYSQQSITLRNVGGVDASVSDLVASDSGVGQQFYAPAVIPDRSVSVGRTRTIDLTFVPARTGQAAASITLTVDSDPAPPRFHHDYVIEVTGRGLAPVIALDPTVLDFGAIAAGTMTARTLVIRNDGDAPLHVGGIAIVAGGPSFQLDPAPGFPIAIQAGATHDVVVRFFAGMVPGSVQNAEWEVASDDPTRPQVRLKLRGEVAGPRVDVRPDAINFQLVTARPAQLPFTVRNLGSTPLTLERIRLLTATDFALVGLPALPMALASGAQVVVKVEVTAMASGQYDDRVQVRSDDAQRPVVWLNVHADVP